MAGKLSPGAQQQLAKFESFVPIVGRINSLTEQFAVAKNGQDNIKSTLKRAAGHAKLTFMTAGLDQLSQLCGAIEIAAGRSGSQGTQTRTLRELVGSLKFQLDFAIRSVIREDTETQALKKQAAERAKKAQENPPTSSEV
jgi:hypothetical protein